MKTAVSIPDQIFNKVDRYARKHKMSRSAVFAKAAEEFLTKREPGSITEQLNLVYANSDSSLDPVIEEMQRRSIFKEEW